jgi:hypothetical protein
MARTKLEINKVEFQTLVTALEAKQTFANPSHLWKAVEDSAWAKQQQPRALTASVAFARAKELGIVSVTPPGKKGRGGNPNLGNYVRGPRIPRSQKMKAFGESFTIMREEVPEQYQGLIDKIEKGSIKAAIKLKCLDCSAWDMKEVRGCVCPGCSLYPFRPGANKKVVANVSEVEDESDD